jgi:hypothetical protein
MNVVRKSHNSVANICRLKNDAISYESLNDAIINAQHIGASLLDKVKPENLFFIFGQTVQSLQSAMREFADKHLVTYPTEDCYAPVYTEKDACKNKYAKDICAIMRCKIINAESLQPRIGTKQEKAGDNAK